ncbi:MFS transporter [Cellulophaga baltica]|uniref:MFS transporter n=1 Tax=Cellulophaga TaxID=104264 RepID=UPI001C077AC2|nr:MULTISPECIES: MFS transporter [Cellulophaga]MBU2995249.1 MFS transporter [Cellulophaga baltica]MDO6766644.1 MFS transporter [Cellulophaga sp. 1_MG-2023]
MNKINTLGIAIILFTSSLTIMVGTVIAPSLTEIAKQLNFAYSPGWLITLPSLGVVLSASLVGRLLNKIGAFKLLCLGLIPYAAFGFLGGYITNSYLLIADRILLGPAAVAVQVALTSYIADYFVGKERMKLIAWQGMAIELGGVVFLSLGGILGDINWRFPFIIYLIALLCFVFALIFLPKNNKVEIDLNTEKTLINSNEKREVNLIFWGSFAAMVLFFVSFVRLPQFLPDSFGFSDSYVGYFMASISLIAVVSASQMPKVVDKLSPYKTVVLGFIFFMMGYICFAFATSIILLVFGALFTGIGFGFTIPLFNHMMVEVSTSKTQGKNLGLFSMGVFAGQFISTFIEFVADDARYIFGTASFLALLIGIVFFVIFKKIKLIQ